MLRFKPRLPGSWLNTPTCWTKKGVSAWCATASCQIGVGKVPVQMPRVRDRGANEDDSKIKFTSKIVPPYLRKAKSVDELLPWLYLKGISTGDFSEALAALLGPDAEGLSASTITRLKAARGGMNTRPGASPISRASAMSTFGRMGSTSRRVSTEIVNLCW